MTVVGPHPDRCGLLMKRSDICSKNPVALPG